MFLNYGNKVWYLIYKFDIGDSIVSTKFPLSGLKANDVNIDFKIVLKKTFLVVQIKKSVLKYDSWFSIMLLQWNKNYVFASLCDYYRGQNIYHNIWNDHQWLKDISW